METEIVTESVATEPVLEVAETEVTNSVDEMSDDEFNEMMDGDIDGDSNTDNADDNDTEPDVNDDSLDDLYSTQMSDADAKLDKPIFIKVDGQIMEITNINDLKNMAERGTSVTKKFQKLSEDRKALEAQLEALDVEPNVMDDSTSEVETVANEILTSNYADDFKDVIARLPSDVVDEMRDSPQMLKAVAQDVESGLTQNIMAEVNKLMVVKGMSFQDAYITAGKSYHSKKESVNTKKQILKSQPKQSTSKPVTADIDNMSDAEFDRYFSNI